MSQVFFSYSPPPPNSLPMDRPRRSTQPKRTFSSIEEYVEDSGALPKQQRQQRSMTAQEEMLPRGIIDNPNMGDPIGSGRPGGAQAIGAVAVDPDIPDKGDAQLINVGGGRSRHNIPDNRMFLPSEKRLETLQLEPNIHAQKLFRDQFASIKKEHHDTLFDEGIRTSSSAMHRIRSRRGMQELRLDPDFHRLVVVLKKKIQERWRSRHGAVPETRMDTAAQTMAVHLAESSYAQALYGLYPEDPEWEEEGVLDFIKG